MPRKRRRNKSDSNRASRQMQIWVALIGGIGLVIAALFTGYFGLLPKFEREIPRFTPDHPVLNPHTRALILKAANKAARVQAPLDVEFDKLLYEAKGIPQKNTHELAWKIVFHEFLDQRKLQNGLYTLRVRFPNSKFSELINIEFYAESPIVSSTIENKLDNSHSKVIRGKARSHRQDPKEWLQVDVIFHHEGQPMQIPLPVKRVTDEQTQQIHFEFETMLESLPEIDPDDPRYAKPFFAFRVMDKAGNEFYNEFSYAQFMAPGRNRFQLGNTQVYYQRKDLEHARKSIVDFRFIPMQKPTSRLYQGHPAITLKVEVYATDINRLEWTALPQDVRPRQPMTLVYRNDNQLAVVFAQTYTDKNIQPNQDKSYQVFMPGRDGVLYSSNIIKPPYPMRISRIVEKFGPSTVFIAVEWKLIHGRSNKQVYHRHVGGGQYPAYLKIDDQYYPWLSTHDEKGTNTPIGSTLQGSGFIVTTNGFILTTRHLGAPWHSRYRLPLTAKSVVFDVERESNHALKIRYHPDASPVSENERQHMIQQIEGHHPWVPNGEHFLVQQRAGSFYAVKSQLEGRPERLDVTFYKNKRPIPSRLAKVSAQHNVVLIKTEAPNTLPRVTLYDNYDEIRPGNLLTILGYPSSSSNNVRVSFWSKRRSSLADNIPSLTATQGLITKMMDKGTIPDGGTPYAENKELGDVFLLANVDTDYSGGPVFDERGRVIGIFANEYRADNRISLVVPIRFGFELMSVKPLLKQ